MNIMGMVLPLIGGFVLKNARKVIAENLKVSKSMEPYMGTGGLSAGSLIQGLVKSAMSGGMGALVQNPVGAITGALTGQLGGITGQLANIPGASVLTDAIHGDLGGALGALASHTDMMSGLAQATENGFGPMQVLGHANLLSSGFDMPAGIGMDNVLAPFASGGLVGAIQSNLPGLVAGVAGGGNIGAAVAQVQAWAGTINGVVNGSVNALKGGQDAMASLSNAASMVHELVAPTNALGSTFLNLIAHPDVVQSIAQAQADLGG